MATSWRDSKDLPARVSAVGVDLRCDRVGVTETWVCILTRVNPGDPGDLGRVISFSERTLNSTWDGTVSVVSGDRPECHRAGSSALLLLERESSLCPGRDHRFDLARGKRVEFDILFES